MITFIQINLLLALTYLVFIGVQKLEELVKLNSSPKAFLRCAQLLIVFIFGHTVVIKDDACKTITGLSAYISSFSGK